MGRFKRDNDLVKKASAIADNVSAEDAKILNELISRYNSATYAEHSDRHQFYQEMVSDMTNDMGFDDDGLAEKMANEHPTIQQSFMRFVAKFIKKMASKEYWDARNESAVQFAQGVGELANTYFPFV